MKTLLIRDVPDDIHETLVADAERNRRSKEKQALFIIETALTKKAAETCGELLAFYESVPEPSVEVTVIERHLAKRGRRSRRP